MRNLFLFFKALCTYRWFSWNISTNWTCCFIGYVIDMTFKKCHTSHFLNVKYPLEFSAPSTFYLFLKHRLNLKLLLFLIVRIVELLIKCFNFILQIQFVLVIIHAFQLCFIECDYPKAFVWWIGGHGVMFYILFSKFYKETYKDVDKKQKVKVEVSKEHLSQQSFAFKYQTELEWSNNHVLGCSW